MVEDIARACGRALTYVLFMAAIVGVAVVAKVVLFGF